MFNKILLISLLSVVLYVVESTSSRLPRTNAAVIYFPGQRPTRPPRPTSPANGNN